MIVNWKKCKQNWDLSSKIGKHRLCDCLMLNVVAITRVNQRMNETESIGLL